MRFVIHIGTHKTGTSSIQTFCVLNRKALLKRGIYYPTNKYSSKSFNFLASKIAFGQIKEPKTYLSRVARDASRKGAHTILLSAESLYAMHSSFYRLYNRHIDNYWASEHHAIQVFRECIPSDNITILCYVRRQDKFLESIYNQCVKHETGYSGTIEEFTMVMKEMLDYAQHMKIWAEIFGIKNIVLRSFDKLLKRDLISDFLFNSVGIEDYSEFNPLPKTINERLKRDILEYKRILNGIPMPRYEAALHMYALWEISQQMKNDTKEQKLYLTSEQRNTLINRYEENNNNLLKLLNGGNVGPLFSLDDLASLTTAYPGLTTEKAIQIAYLHHQKMNTAYYKINKILRHVAQVVRNRYPHFEEILNYIRHFRHFVSRSLTK